MSKKQHWPRVPFAHVVRLNTDRVPDPAAAGIERYVGIEHITPGDLRVRSWGLVAEGTTFTNRFRPGQVLFPKRRAYQRKVAVAEFEGVCSGDIYVLESKDPAVLLPELLPFICQTDGFFAHAVGTSAGSLSPRTNWSHLAAYEFPLPPPDEQRRLVEVLTASSLIVEAYLEAYERCLKVLRSLQKTYFVDNAEGKLVKIGEVAKVQNGTTPSRSNPAYWQGDTPWLPTGKVNERVIQSADEFITRKALAECSLSIIPAGSTLIAMIGQGLTRGKAALLQIDACINQNFGAVTPSDGVDSRYLYYQLDIQYEKLRGWSHGTNQHALNCSLLRDFPIWLPPLKRQMELSEELRHIDEAAKAINKQLENSQKLYSTFGDALLTRNGDGDVH